MSKCATQAARTVLLNGGRAWDIAVGHHEVGRVTRAHQRRQVERGAFGLERGTIGTHLRARGGTCTRQDAVSHAFTAGLAGSQEVPTCAKTYISPGDSKARQGGGDNDSNARHSAESQL